MLGIKIDKDDKIGEFDFRVIPEDTVAPIEVIRIKEGDVLVVTVPCPITLAAANSVKETFAEVGIKNKVVVLSHGAKLSVVSSEEAGPEAVQ